MTCGSSVRQAACVRVLVDQAAQDGFSADLPCVDVGQSRAVSVTFVGRDALGDALVRPGGVVVRLVLGQDGAQVCLAEDQHVVQHLAAQGADEALADRVHPRRLDRAAQNPGPGGLEHGVEGASEVRVPGHGSETACPRTARRD